MPEISAAPTKTGICFIRSDKPRKMYAGRQNFQMNEIVGEGRTHELIHRQLMSECTRISQRA